MRSVPLSCTWLLVTALLLTELYFFSCGEIYISMLTFSFLLLQGGISKQVLQWVRLQTEPLLFLINDQCTTCDMTDQTLHINNGYVNHCAVAKFFFLLSSGILSPVSFQSLIDCCLQQHNEKKWSFFTLNYNYYIISLLRSCSLLCIHLSLVISPK